MALRPTYLFVAAAFFLVEVAIAVGIIPGTFVRHSVGDVLVIPLLYFFLRGIRRSSVRVALVLSLAAGVIAEGLQYLRVGDALGLQRGSLLSIVLGSTFSWLDLLMYAIGGLLALSLDLWLFEQRQVRRRVSDTVEQAGG